MFRPSRIVSGGQTGADRAGLDVALTLGIPHGGWCPRGRLAEDGVIPTRYALTETASRAYRVRTEQNVRDSDATVVFTQGPPGGGSGFTLGCTRKRRKPALHLDLLALGEGPATAALMVWLVGVRPGVLNVAGARESTSPGMHGAVVRVLTAALGARARPPARRRRPAAP